ncbi:MAG: flagellar basal body P-ring formation protein FlgA [Planctomycetes bacterium]|nr:flagellar basal body P-ring formation protein FlgA [Planctomycetota bacterium]
MSLALTLLMVLGSETIALKEKASVSGRWVRVIDLLDETTDNAARLKIADLYLGRAPEEGKTRTITVDEIRREMERRGLDPAAFAWRGDRVEVSTGSAALSESLRSAVAFEIKRHLMEREAGLRSDEVSVRVVQMQPASCPEGVEVAEIKPRGAGYVASLSNGTKVDVVARIFRVRDVVFAVRDLVPGRAIDRADLEIKRVEMAEDERPSEPGSLIGAVPATRIRQGAAVTVADLRLKSVLKKGDVVRAVSSGYEVDARALEDGAPGQEISLEFVSSRNRLRAKVASGSRVDVVEAAR